jgi:phage/plasmid-associated DNA primase
VLAVGVLRELLERGKFTETESTRAAHDEFWRGIDSVKAFVGERLELDATGETPKAQIYRRYKDWMLELGSWKFTVSERTFWERFRHHVPGAVESRPATGPGTGPDEPGKRERVIRGVRLVG